MVLSMQARRWALALAVIVLVAPLEARAEPSAEAEAVAKQASAVQISTRPGAPAVPPSIETEMARVLTRLERLSNRLAEVEQRLDHVVPPAPRVQCNHVGRCWTY